MTTRALPQRWADSLPAIDTAIWIDLNCYIGTPGHAEFLAHMEAFCRRAFRPPDALARSEWSKSWAYTADGPFRSAEALAHLRASFGRRTWASAVHDLRRLDPAGVFQGPFAFP